MIDMIKTTMIAVRHGETVWNTEKRYQGQLDSELTRIGKMQSEAVAIALAEQSPLWDGDFTALYSSDLGRAVNTARYIEQMLDIPLQQDPRLREIRLGTLQGQTRDAIRNEQPEMRKNLDRWDYAPPQGESKVERYLRTTACMLDLFERHQGETFIVVTHGGVLDGFLRYALRIPLSDNRRFSIFNGSINVISRIDGNMKLESWGIVHHLKDMTVIDGEKI